MGPRLTPEQQDQQPLKIAEMGYDYGSADAPVKVLELSDFGCGYCRQFTEESFPILKEIYVDSGLIEWKFVPFVLGMFPNGLEAATAAECAGEQDQFYRLKNRLFATQSGWRNTDTPYAFLSGLAEEEGLDVQRFNRCIVSGWRDAAIRANIRLGRQAGIQGTPLFIIDGRPLAGALPLREFRDVLDAALQQRGVVPPPRE
jgi:protein-disulfide isomerase